MHACLEPGGDAAPAAQPPRKGPVMADLNPLKKVSDVVSGVTDGVRTGIDDASVLAKEVPGAGRDVVDLWVEMLKIGTGHSEVAPERGDKRFNDPTWQSSRAYRAIAQGYLAGTRVVDKVTDRLEQRDFRHAQAVKLVAGIVTSALSPTNYILGNPAALKRAYETRRSVADPGWQEPRGRRTQQRRHAVDGAQGRVHRRRRPRDHPRGGRDPRARSRSCCSTPRPPSRFRRCRRSSCRRRSGATTSSTWRRGAASSSTRSAGACRCS